MSKLVHHLAQAQHNEKLAQTLLNLPPYHDWAITAAFYAAIHYAEAAIFSSQWTHSETSIEKNPDGRNRYTPHAWRIQLLQRMRIPGPGLRSFKVLRDASQTARYLSEMGDEGVASFVECPASSHIDIEQAKTLVNKHLLNVRKNLGY